MLDTNIQVKTDQFDGPLGLLLLLVQKEEMSIKELDLNGITKQYLAYLSQMKEINFDLAGEYLYLAATLLLLKSKNCITEEETERLKDSMNSEGDLKITSEEELIRRLEELQHFQKMGQALWNLPKKGHEIFIKPKIDRKAIVNSILTPMDLSSLTTGMIDLIRKENRKYTVLRRDKLSIKEKLQFLKTVLESGKQANFEDLIEQDGDKEIENIVITFISLLELARLKKVKIFQNEDKSDIYVDVVGSLEDFDVALADGFEDEDELEKREDIELKQTIENEMQMTDLSQAKATAPAPELIQ